MAWTNAGKKFLAEAALAKGMYIGCLDSSDAELSGHGYARRLVPTAGTTVSAAGVITPPANLVLWTASDASAGNPDKFSIYSAETGGSRLQDITAFSTDVDAPSNGQAVRLTCTITT